MVAACKGFVAFQVPQLQDKDSDIKITDEEASWIGKFTLVHLYYYFSLFAEKRTSARDLTSGLTLNAFRPVNQESVECRNEEKIQLEKYLSVLFYYLCL